MPPYAIRYYVVYDYYDVLFSLYLLQIVFVLVSFPFSFFLT